MYEAFCGMHQFNVKLLMEWELKYDNIFYTKRENSKIVKEKG